MDTELLAELKKRIEKLEAEQNRPKDRYDVAVAIAQFFDSVAETNEAAGVEVLEVVQNHTGPLGGVSSGVTLRLTGNDGREKYVAVAVYDDDNVQNSVRRAVRLNAIESGSFSSRYPRKHVSDAIVEEFADDRLR